MSSSIISANISKEFKHAFPKTVEKLAIFLFNLQKGDVIHNFHSMSTLV